MIIRRLTQDDADDLWQLRLDALESTPAAFAEAAEEHRNTSAAAFADRLRAPGNFVFGAFDGAALVGMVGLHRHERVKRRHKGTIWGMFVRPEHRHRGIARALVAAAVGFASQQPGLTHIQLSVTAQQHDARRLYLSLGFVPFGLEPAALQVDGTLIDEEHMILAVGSVDRG